MPADARSRSGGRPHSRRPRRRPEPRIRHHQGRRGSVRARRVARPGQPLSMPAPHERGWLDRRTRSPHWRRATADIPDHGNWPGDSPKRSTAPREPAAWTSSLARRTQAMTLRLYRALIRLLPRRVRERDGDEMARTLADQIAAARAPSAVHWRALRRFPLLLALEWRDELFAGRIPAPPLPSRGSRMESVARMIRQGARGLARTRVFSLSVILLLGIGVGSVSAIFAVVDHVSLRPMPYPDANRLVVIQNGSHSIPAIRDMQAMRSIDAWGAASTDNARLTDQGEPQRVRQALVTDGFFPMFGARAAVGRLLQPSDSEVANTAVLSYGIWTRVFGGDPNVVGRTIHINDAPVTVVGVLDPNFPLPEALVGATVDLWRPLDPAAEYMTKRDYWMFNVAGRLRATATIAQAQQEASRIANDRAKAFPQRYTEDGRGIDLPVRTLRDATTGSVERPLRLLLGAVSLLLLVACANVTHLFLARGVGRSREMAVRRALGARTRSLVAQLLIESGMLGAAGAVLGALIAYAGVRALLALMPTRLPRAATIADRKS